MWKLRINVTRILDNLLSNQNVDYIYEHSQDNFSVVCCTD